MPWSTTDSIFLQTHGFFNVYDSYRDRLLVIAKEIYQRLKARSGISPDPFIFETFLEAALIRSGVFADIVADLCVKINFPGPRDPFWPDFFAGPIARFVTDREWPDISF